MLDRQTYKVNLHSSKSQNYCQITVNIIIIAIRTVAGQRSSPCQQNQNAFEARKKMNSKSLEYGNVLYFDLQPHPKARAIGSAVMEWKQTLVGSYI